MTGEMSWADLKNYPDMLELVRKIRKEGVAAQLRPFDVYQGPYIAVRLEGSPKTRKVTGWDLEVWYEGKHPDLFVIEYKRKFTKPMWADQVVEFIWKKKPKRKAQKKGGRK
jgi:hypothetical protein